MHLELGGKAPFVVFDDADLEAAVHGAVAASLINAGQDCTAATRAFVHRSVYDAFVAGVAELMAAVRLGPTGDEATDLGPLSSPRAPGPRWPAWSSAPVATRRSSPVARSPPVTWPAGATTSRPWSPTCPSTARSGATRCSGRCSPSWPFDDDDEAIRLANDTEFGLAASAWTRDVYRAGRATREIRAGCVWVNDHIPIISEMPHGGYRHCGFGKDMSAYSFDEYTQVKHVMHDNTAVAHKPWHRTIFTLPG